MNERKIELQIQLKKYVDQIRDIELDDEGEKRTDLEKAEYEKINHILDLSEEVGKQLEVEENLEGRQADWNEPTDKPATQDEQPISDNPSRIFRKTEKRTYRNLFGEKNIGNGNFKTLSEFMSIIGRNQYDPRLKALEGRAMTEGIASDGGYMIPGEFGELLLDPVLENSVVLSRADVRPMKSNDISFPAWGIGDHSTDIYDGIIAYFVEEAGSFTETTPKVRDIKLKAKKLGIYTTVSNEWLSDLPGSDTQLISALSTALSWYADYYLFNGAGGAQPLGLVNSKCIVSVAKETGQSSDSIVYENLKKMYSRMLPGCQNNAVWICNNNCKPEIMELAIPIGTGGTIYPVLRDGGKCYIFDRPVVFTEKLPALGDANDIIFVDLSQYLVGLRYNVQIARSEHINFTTDKMAYRLLIRLDGQMKQDESLTPKKATASTLSSIVGLAERA